ncbi:MAG: cobalt transporter CbiM [Desulfuromonadales bacterium]|nr:cobalt transporter CbiM [Desulfuromonadales bacterium]
MHIPEGYLGPATYGSLWAVMVPIWGVASRKVKQKLGTAQVPHLAMGAVFSLVAMMFVLPVPGGTTGHISGTALVAILLGPWPAIVAVSVALVIQATVLGVGGITAIGANCCNIAVIGALVGACSYRLIVAIARRGGEPSATLCAAAGAVAAYLAINVGALSTACMLGLQAAIYGTEGGSGYFPFPLEVAIPATMFPHLTVVGALEGTVTALVLFLLRQKGAPMKYGTKMVPWVLVVAAVLGPTAVSAHDYWIEKRGADYAVVYGHREQRLEYDPAAIKKITVLNAAGESLDFSREVQGKAIIIRPAGAAALILADLDSGYWSKTIYGMKNLPKRKASRVVEAFRAYHHSKSIVAWGAAAGKPLEGMKLDIVPLMNPLDLKAGESLPVRVLFDGAPLADAKVELDHDQIGMTDREGTVKVAPTPCRQLITVERREPLTGDPDANFVVVTATLTFEVPQ